jgi:hypothetical protein
MKGRRERASKQEKEKFTIHQLYDVQNKLLKRKRERARLCENFLFLFSLSMAVLNVK